MTIHPVPVPRGVPTAEVERLLRRVAAEHGGVIVDRTMCDDVPLGVRWTVRSGDASAGVIVVTCAPGRVLVESRDARGAWAQPRAGRFAARLAELLDF